MFIRNVMPRFFREADAGSGGGTGGQNADATGGQGAAAAAAASAAAAAGGESGSVKLPWLPNATTEEIAFAQSKGWDKSNNAPVDQVFRSYHNLQKTFGADKAGNTVMIPGETADDATRDAFFNRLGRPEKAEAYTAKEIAGLDADQTKDLLGVAHKNGFTDKQVAALKEWNDAQATKMQTDLTNKAKVEFAAQEANLKQTWGAAYDKNMGDAKIAANKLGLTADQVNAMQLGLGYDGVMKLIHQLGTGLGEGTFHTGDGGRAGGENNNVMTPEQAKTELNRLTNDQEFQKAWLDKMHPRHKEMIDRKSQLSRWATGQK
jgi:hypothetical protein